MFTSFTTVRPWISSTSLSKGTCEIAIISVNTYKQVIKHSEIYGVQRMSDQYCKFPGEGKGDWYINSCQLSSDVQTEL